MPSSLPGIDDDKCHLGPVPARRQCTDPAADDDLGGPASSAGARQSRHDFLKSMSMKKAAFLVREVALHDKKATLQRLRAGLTRPLRACQPHPPAEERGFRFGWPSAEKLACSVGDGLRHWPSCADKTRKRPRSAVRPIEARAGVHPFEYGSRLLRRERQVASQQDVRSPEGASLKNPSPVFGPETTWSSL